MTEETMKEAKQITYKRRWYILGIFSLFTMESCAIWNTWGPVADSAMKVYDWAPSTIALFTMWGAVDFILLTIPSAWLLSKSLRLSIVLGAILMLVAAVIRCVPLIWPSISNQTFEILCHLSAIINCAPGPIAMSAPLQISAAWFPVDERTTATSIGQMANALGVGVSFLMGRVMVDSVKEFEGNSSILLNTTDVAIEDNREEVKNGMNNLMYLHAIISIVIAVPVVLYFPSQPPTPPSNSAAVQRMDFIAGCKSLVKSKNAWFLMITYAVSQSLVQMWQTMMVINMVDLELEGIDEEWASTLGIYVSFVGVGVSVIVAIFMDCFKGRMKVTIIGLFVVSGVIFIVCTLIMEQVITFQDPETFKITIYVLLLVGVSLCLAIAPIAFEFSVELCYPVAEGAIGGWLTGCFMTIAFFFFLVFFIRPDDSAWLNYVLPISVFIPLPFIIAVKESYNRLNQDINGDKVGPAQENIGHKNDEKIEVSIICSSDITCKSNQASEMELNNMDNS